MASACARLKPLSVKKIRSCSPSSIERLHDDILSDILSRLPHESLCICKCISKRWLSLISNHEFIVSFLNHKIRQQALRTFPSLGWVFLLRMMDENHDSDIVIFPSNHWESALYKFTLELRGQQMKIAATFKDLVLCYKNDQANGQIKFYICNPLTMKWIMLPPSPLLPYSSKNPVRAALMCEEPYLYDKEQGTITRYNIDYKFRVVVLAHRHQPEPFAEEDKDSSLIIIFCSETRQWKQVSLVVPPPDATYDNTCYNPAGFQAIVSNKMLYLHYNSRIAAFDPFDITAATSDGSTVMSTKLPSSEEWFGTLIESEGQLFKISVCRGAGLSMSKFKSDGWAHVYAIRFRDKYSISFSNDSSLKVVGVHPSNKDLVYFWREGERNKFIVCNMRTRCIKPLTYGVSSATFLSALRLEFQWWPTPLPVMLSSI